jgi:hypothetical protein
MRHRGRGAALVVAESVSVAPSRSARQGVGAVVATVLGYLDLSDLVCSSAGCLGDDVDEVRLQRFRKLEAFFTQQNANPRVGSAARTPTRESQNTQPLELRFHAKLGDEPEVELVLA